MKRKIFILKSFCIALIFGIISSCSSDYLETNPSNSVSESMVASSIENLYKAINGIHRKMVSQDKAVQYVGAYPGFMICLDASADDMTWNLDKEFRPALQWQLASTPGNTIVKLVWETYYEFILNANLVLKYVDNFMESSPELSRHVKGEALCFRAFSHFMLVQLYAERYVSGKENSQAGIPYKTNSATENLPRNTVEECYSLINKDIDEAIELLEDYTPESVSHFSPIVALGLKSRICLAQQDYAGAASAALKAIEMAAKKGYRLMEGEELYNGFADISTTTKEALWASLTLSDQTVNYYSYMALISWNFNSEPVRIGVKQISQSLYDKIADTDLRKDWWDETGSLPLPKEIYVATPYSNRKFTARSTDNPVSNVSFMRLAELYLVYSEAAVRNNDLDTGKKIFAEFMATRDPQYQVPASQDQLLEDIMISRRVELWGEGFRFYDLKRLNLPLNRDGTNFNAGFCIILQALASDPRWNWAIPQAEMDANPNMVQNQY